MRKLIILIAAIVVLFSVPIGASNQQFKLQAKLKPTMVNTFFPAAFGLTVAQNDDFVFVSAPGTSTNAPGGTITGAIYVYKKEHGRWKNTQIITRTEFVNLAPGAEFANLTGLLQVVSQKNWLFISHIGTPIDFRGSVLIYRLNPKTSIWEPSQILDSSTPGLENLTPITPGDKFPPRDTTMQHGAFFGFNFSADVENGHLLVGAQYQQNTDRHGNPIINSGAAYIFKLDEATQVWRFKQKLVNPNKIKPNNYFGSSVAIHDDLALVSTASMEFITKTTNTSVFVFQHTGDKWRYVQQLKGKSNPMWCKYASINPLDPVIPTRQTTRVGNAFGAAIAMNKQWAVISAPLESKSAKRKLTGAAYFYKIDEDNNHSKRLRFTKKFFSTSASSHLIGAFHVAVHDTMALVSDPTRTGPKGHPFQGALMIFRFQDGKWHQEKPLFARHGKAFDFFGTGVALSRHFVVGGTDTAFFPMLLSQFFTIPMPPNITQGFAEIFSRE